MIIIIIVVIMTIILVIINAWAPALQFCGGVLKVVLVGSPCGRLPHDHGYASMPDYQDLFLRAKHTIDTRARLMIRSYSF